MRPLFSTLVVVLGTAGCGTPPVGEGDLLVAVDFVRPQAGPDCVRFTAADVPSRVTATPLSEDRLMSLTGEPAAGSLRIALMQPAGWSPRVGVHAELLAGSCQGPVLDTTPTWETSFEPGVYKTHAFRLATDGTIPDAGR
jgi:hypothetical protein